jgi:quercetin dioxygenase-like cupin family protein
MNSERIEPAPGPGPASPGRAVSLLLRGGETGESIMMFEQTLPPGTKSTFHLHHDSDEVAYVVRGEVAVRIGDKETTAGPGGCAFVPRGTPHAWQYTGAEAGLVLFLYTPAKAGGLIEEQLRTGRKFGAMSEGEVADICQRHGWQLLGPSPF